MGDAGALWIHIGAPDLHIPNIVRDGPIGNDKGQRNVAISSSEILSCHQNQLNNLVSSAAHNRPFAEKAGIPQKVAKEFIAADKRLEKLTSSKRRIKKRKG